MSQVRVACRMVLFSLVVLAMGGVFTRAAAAPSAPGEYTIEHFTAAVLPGGRAVFSGLTNAPPGTVIAVTGIPGVQVATGIVDSHGNFGIPVLLPEGSSGSVSAVGTTPDGEVTSTASCDITF